MARILTRGAYDVLTRGKKKEQGYKYVTRVPWAIELDHNYGTFAVHHQRWDLPRREEPFFELRGNLLIVHAGYGWDGCSGPTWDTAGNMAPGLAHDCLYQTMRLRYVPFPDRRQDADDDFRELLASEGWGTHRTRKTRVGWFFQRNWGRFRKTYYHKAVRWRGAGSAEPVVPEEWDDSK